MPQITLGCHEATFLKNRGRAGLGSMIYLRYFWTLETVGNKPGGQSLSLFRCELPPPFGLDEPEDRFNVLDLGFVRHHFVAARE